MVQVFCINLKKDIHRRSEMEKIAAQHSFPFEFIEAVEGVDIDYKNSSQFGYDKKARNRVFLDLEKNEIACLLSHKKALNRFLEQGDEYCVILEDDAGLSPVFDEAILSLTRNFKGWDLIKLECRTHSLRGYPVSELGTSHSVILYSPIRSSFGATGILYSREGAQKLLRSLVRFQHAFDTHIGFGWKYGLHVAEIYPSLVFERKDGHSSIGGRITKTRKKGVKAWFIARKERIVHSFMKRFFAQRTKRVIKKV